MSRFDGPRQRSRHIRPPALGAGVVQVSRSNEAQAGLGEAMKAWCPSAGPRRRGLFNCHRASPARRRSPTLAHQGGAGDGDDGDRARRPVRGVGAPWPGTTRLAAPGRAPARRSRRSSAWVAMAGPAAQARVEHPPLQDHRSSTKSCSGRRTAAAIPDAGAGRGRRPRGFICRRGSPIHSIAVQRDGEPLARDWAGPTGSPSSAHLQGSCTARLKKSPRRISAPARGSYGTCRCSEAGRCLSPTRRPGRDSRARCVRGEARSHSVVEHGARPPAQGSGQVEARRGQPTAQGRGQGPARTRTRAGRGRPGRALQGL